MYSKSNVNLQLHISRGKDVIGKGANVIRMDALFI